MAVANAAVDSVERTTYKDALAETGVEPDDAHRSDLIVYWGVMSKRWHWCRDVGVSLEAAVENHKRLGEEMRIVADQVETYGKKKVKAGLFAGLDGWTRGDYAELGPKEPRTDIDPKNRSSPFARRVKGGSAGEREKEKPKFVDPEEKERVRKTFKRSIHSAQSLFRRALDWPHWFEDYVTSGLALTTLLMLIPFVASLIIAPRLFLPTWFFITTLSFGLGTLVAHLTRKYRVKSELTIG